MNHTDFFARTRAIKAQEYKELHAAIELHGGSYEWKHEDGECPIIAVNIDGIQPSPADVIIYKATIEDGRLQLRGVEKVFGNEVIFEPDDAFTGHLSSIIDHLPPINGVDNVTSLNTEEEAV
ncbi:hypothetical protein [Bacteroides sp.]